MRHASIFDMERSTRPESHSALEQIPVELLPSQAPFQQRPPCCELCCLARRDLPQTSVYWEGRTGKDCLGHQVYSPVIIKQPYPICLFLKSINLSNYTLKLVEEVDEGKVRYCY